MTQIPKIVPRLTAFRPDPIGARSFGKGDLRAAWWNTKTVYFSYVGIRVTNLERSLKFYRELFALEEVDRGDNSKFGMGEFVLLRDKKSGMKLELNWYPKGSRYDTPYVVGEGLDHLAFCVDDIEAKFKDLVAKGATATDFGPRPPRSYCYVKDPDGNWIELYQRKEPTTEEIPKGY